MHGQELLDAIDLLPPLFGLALVVAGMANLGELRRLCIGGNWLYRIGNFIIASAAAAGLAVGSALCLELIVNEPSPMLSLGVLIFTAVAGVRGLDALAYRFFGVRLVLSKDGDCDAGDELKSPVGLEGKAGKVLGGKSGKNTHGGSGE